MFTYYHSFDTIPISCNHLTERAVFGPEIKKRDKKQTNKKRFDRFTPQPTSDSWNFESNPLLRSPGKIIVILRGMHLPVVSVISQVLAH